CIAGLERPDAGSIMFDGDWVCREEEGRMVYADKKQLLSIRKRFEMVFQNYQLFPHLNVLRNITLALTEVSKMDRGSADKLAREWLDKMGLSDKAEATPFELSGGQKQRVAIARSCVTKPKLLCFDEPTAALDPETTKEMTRIIRELAAEGMGILIISHDIPFVENVSDRIIKIVNGSITDQYVKGAI
ncbi:MAG: amino acid ABC transporter ATP-binding protein, partial [Lachnospiraceae bacterium]|nr:amino acid ABC transporter ATP-binding protein [Lachnospiraceae bacterium]